MAVMESERMDSTRFSFRNAPQVELARLLEQIRRDHKALMDQIDKALKDNQLECLDGMTGQPPASADAIRLMTELVMQRLGPPLATDSAQLEELRISLQKLLKQLEQQTRSWRTGPADSQKETPERDSGEAQDSNRDERVPRETSDRQSASAPGTSSGNRDSRSRPTGRQFRSGNLQSRTGINSNRSHDRLSNRQQESRLVPAGTMRQTVTDRFPKHETRLFDCCRTVQTIPPDRFAGSGCHVAG
jgi:hypothetical protein